MMKHEWRNVFQKVVDGQKAKNTESWKGKQEENKTKPWIGRREGFQTQTSGGKKEIPLKLQENNLLGVFPKTKQSQK